MARSLNSEPISEGKIEVMMSQFKPAPSKRFFEIMKNAPWQENQKTGNLVCSKKRYVFPRLAWGTAALIILLVVLGITFIPSIRAIAKQLMVFFLPAPSNEINVQVTLTNPKDLYNYSDPVNFTLSIAEAEEKAGFHVSQLAQAPNGLSLIGARYEEIYNAVILLYEGTTSRLFLTQRLDGSGEDVFSIGESAQVENVMIDNVSGELVMGGWKAVNTELYGDKTPPVEAVNITAIWDNSLPQSTLRWQNDGYIYELRSVGGDRVSDETLIALANELK